MNVRTILFAVLAAVACSPSYAQQWTRFRGPNGTGVSQTVFPASVDEDGMAWKVKLPGIGHSSPVIWGNRVFLLSADPQDATRHVLCLNANTGGTEWSRSYDSEPHHLHLRSSYASCTPAVDEDHVYVAWSTPANTTLMALTHDGKQVWARDLGTWTSQHGFGTSPIIYKDLVILNNSQQANQLKPGQKPGKSFVMAFERKTGKEVWRTERVSANVCYSVPTIYTPDNGPDQLLLTTTGDGMFSLDPNTGTENWKVGDAFNKRCVSSPVVAGGLAFGSTGSGGGGNYVAAVRLGEKPEIAYKIDRQAPYVPCVVAKGNLMFLWYDKGFVHCIDVATGKEYFKERIGGGFSGSPIIAGDKVYCINEDGVLISIAAGKEFRKLGETPLGEASRSTPAVSGNGMFLRTYSHLIRINADST